MCSLVAVGQFIRERLCRIQSYRSRAIYGLTTGTADSRRLGAVLAARLFILVVKYIMGVYLRCTMCENTEVSFFCMYDTL